MHRIAHRFLALLVLGLFLVACNAQGAHVGNTQTKPKNATLTAPSLQMNNVDSTADNGVCPAGLKDVPTCLTPRTLRMAYSVQQLADRGFTGKGQTVVDIVSFGSPTLKQDMEKFDQQFGLPPVNLEIISPLNVPEYDPRHDKSGWAGETTLDVQIIHAIAPDAKIVVLTSPVAEIDGTIGLPEFRQLNQYVIDHMPGSIVSQSWGASELTLEDQKGQQELQAWDTMLQKGTTQYGITYFSSSGDDGATDKADEMGTQVAHVPTTSFAADSPWVTSVGGTSVRHTGTTFSEQAWNGSGGGFSRFYKTPSYQQDLPAEVQKQLNNRRGVPDVSGDADPYTGLAFYENGGWSIAGGTSASAPLWAGIIAVADQMAGKPLGFINPALYKLASNQDTYSQDFRDIIVGNNTNVAAGVQGYPAVPGWDPVTGLGTPNAEKLLPDLIHAVMVTP